MELRPNGLECASTEVEERGLPLRLFSPFGVDDRADHRAVGADVVDRFVPRDRAGAEVRCRCRLRDERRGWLKRRRWLGNERRCRSWEWYDGWLNRRNRDAGRGRVWLDDGDGWSGSGARAVVVDVPGIVWLLGDLTRWSLVSMSRRTLASAASLLSDADSVVMVTGRSSASCRQLPFAKQLCWLRLALG